MILKNKKLHFLCCANSKMSFKRFVSLRQGGGGGGEEVFFDFFKEINEEKLKKNI